MNPLRVKFRLFIWWWSFVGVFGVWFPSICEAFSCISGLVFRGYCLLHFPSRINFAISKKK